MSKIPFYVAKLNYRIIFISPSRDVGIADKILRGGVFPYF
jgi:response regulator of citrate/malate metabolism